MPSLYGRLALLVVLPWASCPTPIPSPTPPFTVPTTDPNTPPEVALDIHFPQGQIFTVTPAGHNPTMPVQVPASAVISLVALCTDNDGGCRNVQIFADATTASVGAVVSVGLSTPFAENLDPNATPGGTASQQRNASATLNVGTLGGSSAGLRMDVSARSINAHQQATSTRKVSIFSFPPAPLAVPPCPRFTPIGSPSPVVLDSKDLALQLYEARAANPSETTFTIAVLDRPAPNTKRAWRLTVEEVGLAPTMAIFKLADPTGGDKELLTTDSRNCGAAGKLLKAPGNGSSVEALVSTSDTTTFVLSEPGGVDVAVWSEPTFWLAFGGKRTTVTWIQ